MTRNADDKRVALEISDGIEWGRRVGLHRVPHMFVGQVPFRIAVIYLGGFAYLAKERIGRSWLVYETISQLDDEVQKQAAERRGGAQSR